ncbi:MAG: hypothetical protein OXQ29_16790 [Rhodospirillaceae bacterium]|nr:hypothetical protein [Rhodospirillaceae bacterium]
MNGVRTTYMRRGWLLTALAAVVLLAASPPEALAQITDIAVRSVRIDDANAAGVVAEGTTSNVTVTLNKAVPVGDTVTVTIGKIYANGNAAGSTGNAEDTDVVVSTSVIVPSGASYGSTPIIFGLDNDAVDEAFQISATAIAIATTATPANTIDDTNLPVNTPASGRIDDAQEQAYRFTTGTIASQIREGAEIAFTLLAAPPRPANEDVTLHLAAPRGYAIDGTNVTAATATTPASVGLTSAEAATGQAVTLTGPANDTNRTDDVVTLTAHMGTVVQSTQVAMAEVTVLDLHQLPASDAITADARDNERRDLGMAIESVAEGDTAYVWVAIINTTQDRVDDAEMFTVDVTGADTAQALDARITRPSGDRMTAGSARGTERLGPWVIEVQEDEDVGMENLMLDIEVEGTTANGGGSANGSFSLAIEDNTEKKVWPLPEAEAYPAITGAMDEAAGDDGLNPGESFTVMTSDLFGLMEGYTAAYAASVEGGAVSVSASGDSVTVNAVDVGESKVTVTATARMSSSFQAEQSVSNVASITFPVAVVAVPEPPVEDKNAIEPNSQDDAYPIITSAIEAGAGDEGFNPGESAMVDAADLFTVMDGYTASYAVDVEGDAASASVSGSHVTVMANMAGDAKVTITGTAKSSSSLEGGQPASNVATQTFPVTVVDKALVLTLMAPDNVMDGNVVEGETYELTVSANRMITAAEESVEVMIMRDRAMSDADDSDYTVGSAMLMAGYDSGTAELMITEDMMPDAGTDDNMGEQLVLYGMSGDMETNDITLTIWDAAVPALPLIAQIMLALFLALGGARLYRRRQG